MPPHNTHNDRLERWRAAGEPRASLATWLVHGYPDIFGHHDGWCYHVCRENLGACLCKMRDRKPR
jgi:hypothetical protein